MSLAEICFNLADFSPALIADSSNGIALREMTSTFHDSLT